MAYAEGTRIPVERTKSEIEALLRKHGAKEIVTAWDSDRRQGVIRCKLQGRVLGFRVGVPEDFLQPKDGPRGRGRPPDPEKALVNEECRRWRALLLIIKAKLEVISSGDSTVSEEFLANTLLPGGETVAERVNPEIERAWTGQETPSLLRLGS